MPQRLTFDSTAARTTASSKASTPPQSQTCRVNYRRNSWSLRRCRHIQEDISFVPAKTRLAGRTVEQPHCTSHGSLVKIDLVMLHKSTGHFPYRIAHEHLTTTELLAAQTRQLIKSEDRLMIVRDLALRSRFASITDLERRSSSTVHDHEAQSRPSVLVQNKSVEPIANTYSYHVAEVKQSILKARVCCFPPRHHFL